MSTYVSDLADQGAGRLGQVPQVDKEGQLDELRLAHHLLGVVDDLVRDYV